LFDSKKKKRQTIIISRRRRVATAGVAGSAAAGEGVREKSSLWSWCDAAGECVTGSAGWESV
jgi:hypothetical protein